MAARLQEWHEANNDLWSELIEALEGGSMTLARKIETGDGKAVWDALLARYGGISFASQITVLEGLFSCKMAGNSITAHVANWRGAPRGC